MICMMLLPISAMADAVLQDEQPPLLVTRTNETGETVFAVICDAQGNEIAQVKEEGFLELTDVHDRDALTDTEAKARLTSAYLGVMNDVHHSDVECILHEHDVKVDINDVLASLSKDIDAHELVMYELYDVNFADELAAQVPEGGCVELAFEVNQMMGVPLITLFTPDGEHWQVLPTVDKGNAFAVQLPCAGTLALLCDGQVHMGIGEQKQPVATTPDENGDESSGFTPSASGRPSPRVVTFEGANGETIIGYIRNTSGDVEIAVPDQNYVLVTPVAERDCVVDIQTHEHLEWSYDGILKAADVGELVSDSHEGSIADDLDSLLQHMNLNLQHDHLAVKDLFEVTAYGDYLHYLYDEDYYLEIALDADLDPEKPLAVIHSNDSEYWHVHENVDVIRNADGTVTLRLYDLGSVAFLVEAEYNVDVEGAVQAP